MVSSWKRKFCLSKSDESITTSDEEHEEIHALFNGEMHTKVENDDGDEHTFLESKSGENWNLPQEEKKISISDHEIKNLQVKKLNKLLRNFSTEEREKIRRRRRSLKNRGCAKTCRLWKQQVLNLVVTKRVLNKKAFAGAASLTACKQRMEFTTLSLNLRFS